MNITEKELTEKELTEKDLLRVHQYIIFLQKAIYIEENNVNIFEEGVTVPIGSSENVFGLIYRIIKSPELLTRIKAYHDLKQIPTFEQDNIHTCKDNKYTLQILNRIRYVIQTIPIPELERKQINQRLKQFGEFSIENHEYNSQIQLDYYINLEKRIFLELYGSILSKYGNKILGNDSTVIENIYKIITNNNSLEECPEYFELKILINSLEREDSKVHVLKNNETIEHQFKKIFKKPLKPIVEKIG